MLVSIQSTSLTSNRPSSSGVRRFPFYQMRNVLHLKPYEKIENFSNEAVAVLSEGSLFMT